LLHAADVLAAWQVDYLPGTDYYSTMLHDQKPQGKKTEALPDELLAAAAEVDRPLLQWFCSLSMRERLRAATRARRALAGFRVASERS
jgi:hypothetical protein